MGMTLPQQQPCAACKEEMKAVGTHPLQQDWWVRAWTSGSQWCQSWKAGEIWQQLVCIEPP